jgi:hypothetical protein
MARTCSWSAGGGSSHFTDLVRDGEDRPEDDDAVVVAVAALARLAILSSPAWLFPAEILCAFG